jgi:hypothetical protein
MYERFLEPDSHEMPSCACGKEMRFTGLTKRSEDASIKRFECDSCDRELLLTVWAEILPPDQLSDRL